MDEQQTDASPACGQSRSTEGLGGIAEECQPIALMDWSLHVDCPMCEHSNDLASGDHDSEHHIAHHIFHNTWDKLQGWEVTCEKCGHEFAIKGVEY
jgi:hypothetical protein